MPPECRTAPPPEGRLTILISPFDNNFFTMEPTQTINLIALSLIVVIHAGVLALRLGISLGRN